VAAASTCRSCWNGGRRSALAACQTRSALSSRFAATLPGRCPASVAELNQNTTTISAMSMAKIRPNARSIVVWCTAPACSADRARSAAVRLTGRADTNPG